VGQPALSEQLHFSGSRHQPNSSGLVPKPNVSEARIRAHNVGGLRRRIRPKQLVRDLWKLINRFFNRISTQK
jgi:hypothetical protein